MKKSHKRRFFSLFNLITIFVFLNLIIGCGGSGGGDDDGDGNGGAYTLTITTDPQDLTALNAGETVTITATVTDSDGAAASGQAVTFTLFQDKSGATLTTSGVGSTNANGVAEAYYTAGSNNAGSDVQDIVQVSIPDSTKSVTITREAGAVQQEEASSLDLAASPTSIKTDGSTTSTITVNALNAGNAIISGVTVYLSTDTGVLSAPSVTTPGTVTLSRGGDKAANKANRTATITASTTTSAGEITAQIPVQIEGSTVSITSDASAIPTTGSTNLTVTVKDAGGNPVSGAEVELTQSVTGRVTFGSSTGTTDISGQFKTTATGNTNGSVTITATWLGTTGTTSLTVGGSSFYISSPTADPATMKLSETLPIVVEATGVTRVTFVTTIGSFDDPSTAAVETSKALTVTVSGGKATANLDTDNIGIASIQVYNTDNPTTSDTLTVAMASGEAPSKIVLQAFPTVVPISVGTTAGSSTLVATVYDASNNPLINQPVSFEIVDGTSTSGGETITPVVQLTAATASGGLSIGQARTTFTSGSMPSAGTGVKIRARVVGTPVVTGTAPSGNDISIVIGGVAGSIAFGQDSKAAEDSTGANYLYKMSVLVADANGNPVAGAKVSLGVWPIAWCTGSGCLPDQCYYNEDDTVGINENMILDTNEDGYRIAYCFDNGCTIPDGTVLPDGLIFTEPGTKDTFLTPVNSVGGTVPSSVTTDENGVAGFTLSYPKTSGMWIYDRIRATTSVQGTETRAETIVYLKIVVGEEVICADSPFKY